MSALKLSRGATLMIAVAIAVAVAGALLWRGRPSAKPDLRGATQKKAVAPVVPAASLDNRTAAKKNTAAPVKRPVAPARPEDTDASDKEVEAALAKVQEDLDSNDAARVVAAANKLMNHPNPQVRLKAVDAFGSADDAAGLPGLVSMLTDQDGEVAKAAMEAWRQQVSMIDGEVKADMVEMVGDIAVQSGQEAFQDLLMTMNDIPDERALQMLNTFAEKTTNPEVVQQILEEVNFRLQFDKPVEKKEDIAAAIKIFQKNNAAAAAATPQ